MAVHKPELIFISNFSKPGRGTYSVCNLIASLPSFSVIKFDAMDERGARGPLITVRGLFSLMRLVGSHPQALMVADTGQGLRLMRMIMWLFPNRRYIVRYGAVYQRPAGRLRFKPWIQQYLRDSAIRCAEHVIVPSESARQALTAASMKSANEITVIPNGQYWPAGSSAPLRDTASVALRFVGRLDEGKAPETAIETLAECRKRHGLAAQLDILGEGPLHGSLEALAGSMGIQEFVHFHGYVDDPWSQLPENTILLHPSKYDGFGFVVLEAIARGVPCVVFAGVGGPEEIVAKTGGGVVLPERSARTMADAVAAMFTDVSALTKQAARARDIARAQYSPKTMVARYDALLSRLRNSWRFR